MSSPDRVMTEDAAGLIFEISGAHFGKTEIFVQWINLLGYVASLYVSLAFYMEGKLPLCIAFLAYAAVLHLARIVIAHSALIPISAHRQQFKQIGVSPGRDQRQVPTVK